jgi:hypothetical protein
MARRSFLSVLNLENQLSQIREPASSANFADCPFVPVDDMTWQGEISKARLALGRKPPQAGRYSR